jgi:hypothetical protein
VVASQQVKRKAVCQVCANKTYQRCIFLPIAPHSSRIMLATCTDAVSICFTCYNLKKNRADAIEPCGAQLDKLVDTMVAEIALAKADLVVVGSQVLSDMKVRAHIMTLQLAVRQLTVLVHPPQRNMTSQQCGRVRHTPYFRCSPGTSLQAGL